MKTGRPFTAVVVTLFLLAVGTSNVQAASVYIPNASFESPETVFVDVNTAPWQKGSTPAWYDEGGGYAWSQLTGVFLNVPPEDPAHIDNCDGKQAVWLFAVPEAELYQDLEATFEVGRCYELAVGVIGGGGNMRDNVPLEIRLYYRDAQDARVTIESTSFVYRTADGYIKHLNDVRLALPAVRETDPWAGKHIGVQIISTLTLADLDPTTGRAGGYWDLDNVRLTESLPLPAVPVFIPNSSFESPETVFVDVNTAPWQKGSTPAWYDEGGGYAWSQLTGVFPNVPPEDPAHIDNCDGKQAVWLFALPEVELYQDLEATFEVGRCYELAVGVIGGGGNMRDNVPLEIRLYYRDAQDARVTIESTAFVYHTADGYIKHLNDVRLALPAVRETDPWAGKHIGVQIISTLTLADLDPTTGRAGGYWDLDNVRLTESLALPAAPVFIPNSSFESPDTVFVDVNTAPWQKGTPPAWFDESSGYTWSQLTGVFPNVPPEDPAHIDNCDGKQAVWLFALPEVELYQDLEATFEVGRCYELAVGVIGGGGNMRDNVPLEIRLYYRDAQDSRVTIESTAFVYRTADGYIKHLNDVRLALPAVRETDPWAGKHIGVQIISTLTLADLDPTTGRAGGYWDLDNVRLTQSLPPDDPAATDGD